MNKRPRQEMMVCLREGEFQGFRNLRISSARGDPKSSQSSPVTTSLTGAAAVEQKTIERMMCLSIGVLNRSCDSWE